MTTKRPTAVLISDVHYSLNTIWLADAAMILAINKAAELKVPLIDAGDLTNDKAVLRAEFLNVIIDTLEYANRNKVKVYLLVGNHSLLNEKGSEHALKCLAPYATVVSSTASIGGFNFIPYQTSAEDFKTALHSFPKGSQVIIHQGVKEGNAGHYFQDHSAVDSEIMKDYRTIGGHYHNHHTIGTHTFIGNPYTLTYGEHQDHPKGFCILYSDGSVEHVASGLRKHIKLVCDTWNYHAPIPDLKPGDLLWLQIHGPQLELDEIRRSDIGKNLACGNSFKLDLVPYTPEVISTPIEKTSALDLLDSLIDTSNESEGHKSAVKALYRKLMT